MTPILFLLTAATLWGLIGPLSKILLGEGITALETAFWRGVFACIAFGIHWFLKKYPPPTHKKDWIGIVIFSIFGVALLESSFVFAVEAGGAGLASVLLYSSPVWVNFFTVVVLKEQLPLKRILGLISSTIGVLGLCLWGAPDQNYSWRAIGLGLLSGLSYAGFYVSGNFLFKRIHPVVVYGLSFGIGSLAIFIVMISTQSFRPEIWIHHLTASRDVLLTTLVLSVACTYLAYLLYGKGLKIVGPSRASIITMVEPLVSVAVAAWMWGETFSTFGYFFALCVMIGIALT